MHAVAYARRRLSADLSTIARRATVEATRAKEGSISPTGPRPILRVRAFWIESAGVIAYQLPPWHEQRQRRRRNRFSVMEPASCTDSTLPPCRQTGFARWQTLLSSRNLAPFAVACTVTRLAAYALFGNFQRQVQTLSPFRTLPRWRHVLRASTTRALSCHGPHARSLTQTPRLS